MAKYLWNFSYTVDGTKGFIKEGAVGRKAAVEALLASVGGTLEAYYFAFGESDAVLIADLPANADAAAISLAIGASGAGTVKTTVLMTIEEADAAATKARSVIYRRPGA